MRRPDPSPGLAAGRRLLLALLLAAGAGVAPALAQDPSFTLVNRLGRSIQEVYATPSTQRGWGHDRLGNEAIPPGRSHLVRIAPEGECRYDLRVVAAGGAVEERRGLDLCQLRQVVIGPGEQPATGNPPARPPAVEPGGRQGNPSFNLVNQSARPIREVFATPASRRDWGPDLLGATVLAPGRRQAVRLPAGPCLYDLRIVWDGGRVEERRGVDLCQVTDLPFR